jgi:DNA-binding SARP family transcriptional activator
MGLRTLSDGRGAADQVAITLTAGFQLAVGEKRLRLPHSVERLLAYLALAGRPTGRTLVAGTLWIDTSETRAASNLRTALWRLHRSASPVVVTEDDRVALAADVTVDYPELVALARRVIEGSSDHDLDRIGELIGAGDLLPDWDDEWVVADRERFRLLRLEAIERATVRLLKRGDHGQALEGALSASLAEPLRESARRLLIQVHLAEGNVAEALHSYRSYRETLLDEMGLAPSLAMEELVGSIIPRSVTSA